MNVEINHDQKLFVLNHGEWISTLGFDNVFKTLKALVGALKLNISVDVQERGTVTQYQKYIQAMDALRAKGGIKETWFDQETPVAVRRVIERYRKSGDKLRIYYGETSTGRDWMDENDVIGFVGRSTGMMKIPLLIEDGENGGSGMLDHCIVKMQDGNTGKVLYQHAKFHQPDLEIRKCDSVIHGLTHEATANGEVHARFESFGQAAAWVAFMTGASMCKPN